MKYNEHKVFSEDQDEKSIKLITDVVRNFDEIEGGEGERNTIKNVTSQNIDLNIKSFKVPHLVNRIAYSYFRKSKANRSYEYANTLLKLGVNTPKPLAYFEYSKFKFIDKSYYVSEQFYCDLTYRELVENPNYKNHEEILRAFTRFTFKLHEKGVIFLDHSPGNTLIKKNKETGDYSFYLVDLNRMKFHVMNFDERINNFARLTHKKEMVEIMANEYAKLINVEESIVFDKMWNVTKIFQRKYHSKVALKKKIFFWRNK